MKRILMVLLLMSVCLMAGLSFAGNNSKVTICHVPPGNPENAHEIVVSEKALNAHLNNHPGDLVGPCEDLCTSAGECDDANACTLDICNYDGTCDNSQPVDCADGNVCTMDACDPDTGCVNPPVPDANQVACNDGDSCSDADVCLGGACTGTPIPGCCTNDADCPASDACTVRFCDDASSECKAVDTSSECMASACEVAFCDPETGCGTAPVACPDDGDICTVEVCNELICGDAGGCETLPNLNPPEVEEVSCADGLDNDCDTLTDAADPDCSLCGNGVLDPGEVCDGPLGLPTCEDILPPGSGDILGSVECFPDCLDFEETCRWSL